MLIFIIHDYVERARRNDSVPFSKEKNMKKTAKIIILSVLSLILAVALCACTDDETSEQSNATEITFELVNIDDDDAIADELFDEGETAYYTLTGYKYSSSDSAIIANAASNPYYYTDLYQGSRKDSAEYKAEKERYQKLSNLVLPSVIKSTDRRVTVSFDDIAASTDGTVLTGTESRKVRAIGDSALINHTELKTVTVPATVLRIGAGAFSGCSSIEEITLPFVGRQAGSTDNINGARVFGFIFGTTEYTGGASVSQNYNTSGSATYYIPSTLKKVNITAYPVPAYAFNNCVAIEEITCPATDDNGIPVSAFSGCSALKKVTTDGTAELIASAKKIGDSAFANCTSLKSVTFSDSLERIGASAFSGCTGLFKAEGTLTVPASVTFIGESAFSGCSSIKKVVVSATAEVTVRRGAFNSLSALETVELTNATLSTDVFSGWKGDDDGVLKVTCTNCKCVTGDGRIKDAFSQAFESSDGGLIEKNIEFTLA